MSGDTTDADDRAAGDSDDAARDDTASVEGRTDHVDTVDHSDDDHLAADRTDDDGRVAVSADDTAVSAVDTVISAADYRKRSRRAFVTFGAGGIGAYLGFRHIQNRPVNASAPDVLREALEVNERVWGGLERDGARSATYSMSDREEIRVNGRIGIRDELAEDWSLQVVGVSGDDLGPLTLADVQSLEPHDMVWQHKCIEGWSNIVHWTGARFSDFVERFAGDEPDWTYVSLRTPDDEYYVGIDRYTMMHDQTLLAWALNGETLSEDHGAPLRLATPLKYGIKQLKRIASIEFTSDRPADYWAERGYDYHAGF